MRAYCFYNPFSGLGDATPLINLWRHSWESQGWKTEVLSEKDAEDHSRYLRFCKRIDSYPTVNDIEYEHACYVRWLAMSKLNDGLSVMSDYDVMNRSFKPSDAEDMIHYENLLVMEPTLVPCAVVGTQFGFEMLCDEIERYEPSFNDRHRGKPHVSDMEIVRKSRIPFVDICVEFGCSGKPIANHKGDNWRTAKLIHFSTYGFIRKGMKIGSKVDMIKAELAKL